MFSLGLDDTDPAQWGDAELSHLVVPEADYASDSEEEEEEEDEQRGGGGEQPICRILWFLILTITHTSCTPSRGGGTIRQPQAMHGH